jgi:hypothetical protein
MNRHVFLPAFAALALLMTSCSADAPRPSTGATADTQIQPTPGSPPQAFLERAPLDSCGDFTLGLGEHVPATATKCFENAIGAGGAELILTAPTDEGDAVVSWFRALPAGGVEIWTDVRQDKFAGEASWQYSLCPSMDSWLPESAECTQESFS